MQPAILVSILLALASGAFVALQTTTNALMARAVSSPVNAAFVSFAIGTAALALAVMTLGVRPNGQAVRDLPWYAWLGGLYGAFFVAAAAFAVPRVGAAFYIAVLVGGQIACALILDQLGAMGLERQPITPVRIAGGVLVLAGIVLVRR